MKVPTTPFKLTLNGGSVSISKPLVATPAPTPTEQEHARLTAEVERLKVEQAAERKAAFAKGKAEQEARLARRAEIEREVMATYGAPAPTPAPAQRGVVKTFTIEDWRASQK